MTDHKGHKFSGAAAKTHERKGRRKQRGILHLPHKPGRPNNKRMLSKDQRLANKKARRRIENQPGEATFALAEVWPDN